MKFSDKTYNILKWVVSIVLPAIATAVITLGQIFGWEPADMIAQCIVVLQTLLGAIFCVGNATYYASRSNGAVTLTEQPDPEREA